MTVYFVSNAGSNTAPYDTEAKAATALSTIAALPWTASDDVKASSTHTETPNAAQPFTFPTTPGLRLMSVLFNGSGTGALTPGAAVNVGAAAAAVTLGIGYVHGYGMTFVSGTTNNSNSVLSVGNAGTSVMGHKWEKCTFSSPSANTSAFVIIGANSGSSRNTENYIELIDCTISNGANRPIQFRSGVISIKNLALAGTAPTTVFTTLAGNLFTINVSASDLSNLAWTNLMNVGFSCSGSLTFTQCALRSGFTLTTGSFTNPGAFEVILQDADSGDNHYTYVRANYAGTITASNSIYLDASDGTNSTSWHMVGNGNTSFTWPLKSPVIVGFNSATGSGKTATVECTNDGTTFKDNQLWLEVMAKVTSGFTKGTWDRSDRAADFLASGTNQASSAASWTGAGGFSAAVPQKLVTSSFTPAEVGPIMGFVSLAANDDVYVSGKMAVA